MITATIFVISALKFITWFMILGLKIVWFVFFGWINVITGTTGKRNVVCIEEPRRGFGFTDEEILATGLYPDDEGYEMSIISEILDK